MAMESSTLAVLEGGAKPVTATQHAVNRLRDAIISGRFREGEQLRQNDVAAALGVSRTPVRESLRILEAEGWVVFSPHRGAVVARLSADDVRQIFEIRFALESLALRKSIPHLSEAALDAAQTIIDALDHEQDLGNWVALHRRFHLALYEGAGARLITLIQAQYDAVERYLRLELAAMDNAAESQREHRAILDACRKRQVGLAISLYEAHIAEAGEDLAAALEAREGLE